jgi:hypothetical protein
MTDNICYMYARSDSKVLDSYIIFREMSVLKTVSKVIRNSEFGSLPF